MKAKMVIVSIAAAAALASCAGGGNMPTIYAYDGKAVAVEDEEVKGRDCVSVGLKSGECNAFICCP